ncbi:sulfurtransferase [Flavobacterium zepuense]|uniref:Sulfurtransferase n=2 Tax=Flavobacterium zepuense TaxID=2593302 RepID=A0A552UVI5_9FLAO|nr:sulfurtransferase [Flavobacterium zepuense]
MKKWTRRFEEGYYAASIIQADELIKLPKENLILIDASAGAQGRENYYKQHLAGALYVDLDTELAEIPADPKNGGRHPLPTIEKFGQVLNRLGTARRNRIVVYDDKNGANAAARFWWMYQAASFAKVQVLNGGFQAAVDAGFPVCSGTELPQHPILDLFPNTYYRWQLPLATIDDVEIAATNKDAMVIDVRDANRYNGLTEPIDLVAGHIPGAVNIPFSGNLDGDGLFLSATALREKYTDALANIDPQNVIVHCGSGVTACHTLLAMDYAGLPIPKLYVGSWSEWSRSGKKLATSA